MPDPTPRGERCEHFPFAECARSRLLFHGWPHHRPPAAEDKPRKLAHRERPDETASSSSSFIDSDKRRLRIPPSCRNCRRCMHGSASISAPRRHYLDTRELSQHVRVEQHLERTCNGPGNGPRAGAGTPLSSPNSEARTNTNAKWLLPLPLQVQLRFSARVCWHPRGRLSLSSPDGNGSAAAAVVTMTNTKPPTPTADSVSQAASPPSLLSKM